MTDSDPQNARAAVDQFLPLIYDEMRRIARAKMHGRNWTLQPTAIVHEAYQKLIDQREVQWQNRAHFLAIASIAIRRVILEYARERGAQKRGNGIERTVLQEHMAFTEDRLDEILVIDELIERLTQLNPTQGDVARMRFYCDMTVEEVAERLEIGTATVKREWKLAKAWLNRELSVSR